MFRCRKFRESLRYQVYFRLFLRDIAGHGIDNVPLGTFSYQFKEPFRVFGIRLLFLGKFDVCLDLLLVYPQDMQQSAHPVSDSCFPVPVFARR